MQNTRKKISLNFKPAAEAVTVEHLPNGGYISRLNDKYHAVGKPAILNAQGGEQWYEYGQRHREDGPAMSNPDGHQEYWLRGIVHRADGAARIFANGTKHWVQHNQLHREDGAAIEDATGKNTTYFLHGRTPSEEQLKEILVRQAAREQREREEIALPASMGSVRKRSIAPK